MGERLQSIRALYNTEKYSAFEIKTNFGKRTIKLPYFKSLRENREPVYQYTTNIMDYCLYNRIATSNYLTGTSWEI